MEQNGLPVRRNARGIVYALSGNGEYQFLLIKSRKGYWQNPQGGIENGESGVEAVVREIEEESGLTRLTVRRDTRYVTRYEAQRGGVDMRVLLDAYAVRGDSTEEIVLSSEEGHTDFRWVSYNKALDMLTRYPEQKQVFTKVSSKLGVCPETRVGFYGLDGCPGDELLGEQGAQMKGHRFGL